ncbi:MAG: hypothetical protein U9R00_03025 [Patescibacteria group bacterium]|nr:hypothetical protein [Patescibacteria group bacterium]
MQSKEKIKHITNRQGVQLAQKARENGVSRSDFKKFLDNPVKLKDFFMELNEDNKWFEKLQANAQEIGARVHLIPKLIVDYAKSHNELAMAGGPQTGSGYNVLKVGDKYPSIGNKVVEEVIILFNWPKDGGSYQKAVEWGLSNGLQKTVPKEAFTIGQQFPKLNYELGPNPMYVAETTGCSFGGDPDTCDTCFVWWSDAKRESNLYWQGDFGSDDVWFAFRKK